jgi:hypothetical protein
MQSLTRIENELISELSGRLKASNPQEITEGGSPARVVKLDDANHKMIVLKLMVDVPGAVDGHDLDSFRTKIEQILKIRREIPEMAERYSDLSGQFHGPKWSAYTMPFYQNVDIAASIRGDRPELGDFWSDLSRVLSGLIYDGYLRSTVRAPWNTMSSLHVNRLERRFWLLQRFLPAELTEGDVNIINGVRCRNPLKLAQSIAGSDLAHTIEPRFLHYPVHGDLNTRNILMTNDGFRIIDPRGTLDHWDTAYDFSKLLFSLTVYDLGLRQGFEIDNARSWRVDIRGGICEGYRSAAVDLYRRLRCVPGFAELTSGDAWWETRFLFSHAFHLLAEAACRLSDLKERTSDITCEQISPLELANGLYLFGAIFLEDAARQLEQKGAVRHDETLRLLDA